MYAFVLLYEASRTHDESADSPKISADDLGESFLDTNGPTEFVKKLQVGILRQGEMMFLPAGWLCAERTLTEKGGKGAFGCRKHYATSSKLACETVIEINEKTIPASKCASVVADVLRKELQKITAAEVAAAGSRRS